MPPPRVLGDRLGAASQKTFKRCCDRLFYSQLSYEDHVKNSPNHFTCEECMSIYNTAEALKRHRTQTHPAEQKLSCPGCKKEFNRAGALTSHLTITGCTVISRDLVPKLRAEDALNSKKTEDSSNADEGSQYNFPATESDLGDSNGTFDQAVAPVEDKNLIDLEDPTDPIQELDWDAPSPQLIEAANFPALKPISSNASNNNQRTFGMSNDQLKMRLSATPPTITSATNNAWGKPQSQALAKVRMAPSASTALKAPITAQTASGLAWGTSSATKSSSAILFPDAPPAVAPPASLMENLTLAAEPLYGPHDPDNPNFEVGMYYSKIHEAYKCPHASSSTCGRSFKTKLAFVSHLRSAIHDPRQQPQTCEFCKRPFPNLTALTQHFESQSLSCGARNAANAAERIRMMNPVVSLQGQHEDETNRYTIKFDCHIVPGNTGTDVSGRAADAKR